MFLPKQFQKSLKICSKQVLRPSTHPRDLFLSPLSRRKKKRDQRSDLLCYQRSAVHTVLLIAHGLPLQILIPGLLHSDSETLRIKNSPGNTFFTSPISSFLAGNKWPVVFQRKNLLKNMLEVVKITFGQIIFFPKSAKETAAYVFKMSIASTMK